MNKLNRVLSVLLALMMLFTVAYAENTSSLADTNPVLAKVGDYEITLAEADEIAYLLYYYGYAEEYPDYSAAVDYLIETTIIEKHIADAGFDQFTEEELAAFANEAAAEWEAELNSYVEYYLTEDTEDARAQLRTQAEEYYAAQGYNEASVLESMLMSEAYARMEEAMMAGYAPTEDEILSVFNEYGAQYQQAYENDLMSYEYNVNYYGYESWYTPAGYRGVLHILLDVEQELLDAYEAATVALDEANSAETVDVFAVTEAQMAIEDARAAVIASKETELTDIYARLEKGEDFLTLIGEYNTDPGMNEADILAEGYKVNKETAGVLYDADFVNGSFQDHMTAPGTYSTPVVSGFGIHIIYYLNDVPSGLILTDEIRADLEEYLVSTHMQSAYDAGMAQWSEGVEIVIDEEMITNVTAEVLAAMATTESAE